MNSDPEKNAYIVITPAFNEEKHIASAAKSLLKQEILPKKWIIVDDGSNDRTAEIIHSFARNYPFIRCHYREKIPGQSYYGSNVYAIMEGYRLIEHDQFDYLAILDADIELPPHYYQFLLKRFQEDSSLGIASGIYKEQINSHFRKVLNDRRSTPKAIQVFRKECFQQIGGYIPLKYGGEDTCTCFMARMKGWKTWSFTELSAVHLKPAGTGHSGSIHKIRFRQGYAEYCLAAHPAFFFLKSLRRCFLEQPYLAGGLLRMAGYLTAAGKRENFQIPEDLVRFIRREQIGRILNCNRIPKNFIVAENR